MGGESMVDERKMIYGFVQERLRELKDNPDENNKIFIAGEYPVNTGLDFLNENRLYSKPGSGIFYRIL